MIGRKSASRDAGTPEWVDTQQFTPKREERDRSTVADSSRELCSGCDIEELDIDSSMLGLFD